MDVFEYRDRLIQIDAVSDATADGMVYECWDVTPNDGQGLIFSLVEEDSRIVIPPTRVPFDLALLERVVSMLELQS